MKKILSITLGILSLLAVGAVAFMGAKLILPEFQFAAINESLQPEQESSMENPVTSQPENITESESKVSRLSFDEHIHRGDMLMKNGYLSLAIKEYIAATNVSPEKAEPYVKIGTLELQRNHLDQAEKNFKIALDKKPNDYQTITLIGQTLLNKKEIQKARELFDKSANYNPKAKYYQGVVAAFNQEHDLSQQKLNEILQTSSDTHLKNKAQTILDAYAEFKKFQEGSKKRVP